MTFRRVRSGRKRCASASVIWSACHPRTMRCQAMPWSADASFGVLGFWMFPHRSRVSVNLSGLVGGCFQKAFSASILWFRALFLSLARSRVVFVIARVLSRGVRDLTALCRWCLLRG